MTSTKGRNVKLTGKEGRRRIQNDWEFPNNRVIDDGVFRKEFTKYVHSGRGERVRGLWLPDATVSENQSDIYTRT